MKSTLGYRDNTKSVFPALRNISPLINFKSHFQEGGWHSVHHWQFHGPDPTEEHGTLPWVDEEEVRQANTTTTKALSRCKRGIFFHTLYTARCLLMAIKNLNEILRLLSAGKLRRETQCSLFTCCLRILWNYSALSLDWKMASRGPQVVNSLNYPELEEDHLSRGSVEQSRKKREN